MRGEPTVVTPNEREAEELVGHEFSEEEDRLVAMREMLDLGAEEAVMTLPTGCVALVGDGDARLHRVTLEPLETPVSAVGSGDAFLAGYVSARYGGESTEDCLRFGVACGAESTQHFGAGVLDPRRVERMLPDVELEMLAAPALERPG
jgi:1-phosphofructokinase/tagatose 6-phosphate kinase